MTPEHRCYTKHLYKRGRNAHNGFKVEEYEMIMEVKRADQLNSSDNLLVSANNYIGFNEIKDWDDNEVRLLGWLLTEGNIGNYSKKRSKITQSLKHNPDYCTEISNIFEELNLEVTPLYSLNDKKTDISVADRVDYHFYLPQKFIEKQLFKTKPFPRWILQFPQRQLQILLETFLKGDGTKGHNSKELNCFYQKDKRSSEIFQELAFKCGYRASISENHPTCNVNWIAKRNDVGLKPEHITKVQHKGCVWCVSTGNKTWVARRNGRIWITGNSLPYYGIVRQSKARRLEIDYDIEIIGHFHQRLEIPTSSKTITLVNGAWVPKDSFAWKKFGVQSKPEQHFFGVADERPRTWSFEIDLSRDQ